MPRVHRCRKGAGQACGGVVVSASDPQAAPRVSDEERRRIAEAATPGPWHVTDRYDPSYPSVMRPNNQPLVFRGSGTHDTRWCSLATAEFVAANDPQTVLADLDLLDAYRAEHDAVTALFMAKKEGSGLITQAGLARDVDVARARVAELEAQRPGGDA